MSSGSVSRRGESDAPEAIVSEIHAPEVDYGALAPEHYPIAEGLHVRNLSSISLETILFYFSLSLPDICYTSSPNSLIRICLGFASWD